MTNASLTLHLTAKLPSARIVQLTRDLEHDLSRAGIRTHPVKAPPTPGERGEPITLGILALLVTSGTIKAAIECFKSYLSRERSLSIKLVRADGTQVEVTADNVDLPAVREVLESAASAGSA
jgi:Effector Associated Constant Component 1